MISPPHEEPKDPRRALETSLDSNVDPSRRERARDVLRVGCSVTGEVGVSQESASAAAEPGPGAAVVLVRLVGLVRSSDQSYSTPRVLDGPVVVVLGGGPADDAGPRPDDARPDDGTGPPEDDAGPADDAGATAIVFVPEGAGGVIHRETISFLRRGDHVISKKRRKEWADNNSCRRPGGNTHNEFSSRSQKAIPTFLLLRG